MKHYEKAEIKMISLEGTDVILTGSVTNIPIQVGTVEVKPLEKGFTDANGNDFKDISFD